MRKADDEAELISDWKFAAMVVDRFDIFYFKKFVCLVVGNVIKTELKVINGNNLRTTDYEQNQTKAIKNLEIGIFNQFFSNSENLENLSEIV